MRITVNKLLAVTATAALAAASAAPALAGAGAASTSSKRLLSLKVSPHKAKSGKSVTVTWELSHSGTTKFAVGHCLNRSCTQRRVIGHFARHGKAGRVNTLRLTLHGLSADRYALVARVGSGHARKALFRVVD